MDPRTKEHLHTWADRALSYLDEDEMEEVLERLGKTYDSDPEYFDGVGWQRMYDNMQENDFGRDLSSGRAR